MAKVKFGHMTCTTRTCENRVVVKRNTETGTLSYGCDECDGSGYAKVGQGQHVQWMKDITPIAAPVSDQGAAPAAGSQKKEEKKPAPSKPQSTLIG